MDAGKSYYLNYMKLAKSVDGVVMISARSHQQEEPPFDPTALLFYIPGPFSY